MFAQTSMLKDNSNKGCMQFNTYHKGVYVRMFFRKGNIKLQVPKTSKT
jgi:hypothetical protein